MPQNDFIGSVLHIIKTDFKSVSHAAAISVAATLIANTDRRGKESDRGERLGEWQQLYYVLQLQISSCTASQCSPRPLIMPPRLRAATTLAGHVASSSSSRVATLVDKMPTHYTKYRKL